MNPLVGAGRLGAVLMQFPISFQNTPENRAYIGALQRRFDEYPARPGSPPEQLGRVLTELGIGFCNIDQPLLGKAHRPDG
jgi:uncharacterized protein YecE (DUF72 family)